MEIGFPPVYDENSRVLIVGSFPSVRSRAEGFYYGHPQNRFWKLLSGLLGCETPTTTDEKRDMLLRNKIALWDAAETCEIDGSSDATMREVVPNDVAALAREIGVCRVYANGRTAEKLCRKYIGSDIEVVGLPSTSPANAAWSLERLAEAWKVVVE